MRTLRHAHRSRTSQDRPDPVASPDHDVDRSIGRLEPHDPGERILGVPDRELGCDLEITPEGRLQHRRIDDQEIEVQILEGGGPVEITLLPLSLGKADSTARKCGG